MAHTYLLVAGGTGGHVFPALALREELLDRGHDVHVATDKRVSGFVSDVEPDKLHAVPSATLSIRPLKLPGSLFSLSRGVLRSIGILRRLRPSVVIGFGGYPTVPPVVAAKLLGTKALVHEQNAVLGRANRLLIRLGADLATGMAATSGSDNAKRSEHVGNPVRQAVVDAASKSYRGPGENDDFRLLVFGGSQGARVFSDLVPAAVAELDTKTRQRLVIVQQCRPEDLDRTKKSYSALEVRAELAPFFSDMPGRLAKAHLVISRAGASTVAELSVIGRPAILVPYPHALDHDQAANARSYCEAGGGWVFREAELSAERLAEQIRGLLTDPGRLDSAAHAARGQGYPDAVARLAALVEKMAS